MNASMRRQLAHHLDASEAVVATPSSAVTEEMASRIKWPTPVCRVCGRVLAIFRLSGRQTGFEPTKLCCDCADEGEAELLAINAREKLRERASRRRTASR